jgi:hypothetical protein
MRKRIIILASIAAAIAFLVTCVTYVHRDYVGVTGSGDSIRLLGHGPHLRIPGQDVIFYPLRYQQVHLRVSDRRLEGSVDLDMVLFVSVCRESIPSLHRAYDGDYVQRLISPLIVDYLLRRGEVSRSWIDGIGSEDEANELVAYLNSAVADHGVNVTRGWIRSYEVSTNPVEVPQESANIDS